ncbi:MAG: M3 family metallopeptidase [Planctomycetaceae bacterium]|nr:M3 family metallopeptidase [Planctomycetaceae bacterium]
MATAADTSANPLLAPWKGPWGGVPPFDVVTTADIEPALEAGMREQLGAVAQIAADPAPASFENTIAAFERSGRTLARVQSVYSTLTGCKSDEPLRAVEKKMSPKLAAFEDGIYQNDKLFARIALVYAVRESSGLTPEQQRLTWLAYTNFVRAGAKLDAAAKQELSAINQKLAELTTTFSQNLLKCETDEFILLNDETETAGLADDVKAASAEAATALGKPGKWAIQNTRSSVDPFLAQSSRRDLREKVWRMFVGRGDGGVADNNQIITETLTLRARRAKLLGYPTHAHWRVEHAMAKTPERALGLLEAVWKPAVARVRMEVADMQAVADREGAGITIEPWDYRYYAEKVRAAKYDLDKSAVVPYLQLEKLREGMFYTARELFGLEFRPLEPGRVPVYHPDVRVWEVVDGAGSHVGLWYFDPFARTGKRSGAWMSDYRAQERFDGAVSPIVSNNCNFMRGRPGEPVLISWDDATTLFHEFGHALHGLLSNVNYPSLAGTNVARDYVEFPSQLLEHWLSTPEVLEKYALHHESGRPIPKELVTRIERAATFNEGFRTVEFLASALVDMKVHLAGETPIDPAQFERETLADLGMPREIVMRHRLPQFLHIFGGDGYSAAYYSYLWADTLTADAWEAFTEAGGPWDKDVARRLRDRIFSVGNTIDPADSYRAFRGRDAGVDALMRKRGFVKH